AQRFFGDLDDDFLPRLEQLGNGLLFPRRAKVPPARMRPPAAPGWAPALAGVAPVGLGAIEALLPRVALHPGDALLIEGFRSLRFVGLTARGLLQDALADLAVGFVFRSRRRIGFRAVRFLVFLERGVLSLLLGCFQNRSGFGLGERAFLVRGPRVFFMWSRCVVCFRSGLGGPFGNAFAVRFARVLLRDHRSGKRLAGSFLGSFLHGRRGEDLRMFLREMFLARRFRKRLGPCADFFCSRRFRHRSRFGAGWNCPRGQRPGQAGASCGHAVLVFCERLARQNDRLVITGWFGRIERRLRTRPASSEATRRGAGLAIVAAWTDVLRTGQRPVVPPASRTTPAKPPAISSSSLARSAAIASAFAWPTVSATLASAFARPIIPTTLAATPTLIGSLPAATPVSTIARSGVAEIVLAVSARWRAGRCAGRSFIP